MGAVRSTLCVLGTKGGAFGFWPCWPWFRGVACSTPLREFKYFSDRHSHAKWPIPEHLLQQAEALSTLPFTWVFPALEAI